jgi:3-hydroxyisobutyrate dehydrogenase-like beta-hydroxyacid dehydrogenase
MQLGMIGLGRMGNGMTERLRERGRRVARVRLVDLL